MSSRTRVRRTHALSFALTGLLALSLPAQQSGDADRDYVINGNGSQMPSPVATTIGAPGTMGNRYVTQEPGMPVTLAASTNLNVGQVVTQVNSIDLGTASLSFADLEVIGAGVAPGFPGAFFHTDSQGVFEMTVPAPAGLAGTSAYFGMGHVSATSPDGFLVSQVHNVSFAQDPNLGPGSPLPHPGATALALGDDAFVQINFGFGLPFYGAVWQDAYVGSNGFVTLGTGSTSYSESDSALVSGEPRIALWWDDLNPTLGGQVSFWTDGAGMAEVAFAGISEYGQTTTNDMKLTLAAGSFMTMDYGSMAAVDGLVGLSPGGGSAVPLALNLSVGPNTIPPGSAPYEVFSPQNPNDLAGYQVNWIVDSVGNPITQF